MTLRDREVKRQVGNFSLKTRDRDRVSRFSSSPLANSIKLKNDSNEDL